MSIYYLLLLLEITQRLDLIIASKTYIFTLISFLFLTFAKGFKKRKLKKE